MLGFGQLGVVEVSEVLVVKPLGTGELQCRLVIIVSVTVGVGVAVEGVGKHLHDVVESHLKTRRVVVKEGKEHRVVHGDMFLFGHERRSTRPVHVETVPESENFERFSEQRALTDGDLETAPSQCVNKPGNQPIGVDGGCSRRHGSGAQRRSENVGETFASYPLLILAVFQQRAEGGIDRLLGQRRLPEQMHGIGPVEGLCDTRRLVHAELADGASGSGDLVCELLGHGGRLGPQDGDLAFEVGMFDPVVQRSTLEGIVNVSGPVRRDDHDRRNLGLERPKFGHGHSEIRERLEQERLELVVGSVDLVDQQHRWNVASMIDGTQDRSSDEEAFGEQFLLERISSCSACGSCCFGGAKVQELMGVVPLVEGLASVDSLVALEADQFATGDGREHLGDLGLPYARFALEQQWPLQRRSKKDRGGEASVCEIPLFGERDTDRIDRRQRRVRTRHVVHPTARRPIADTVISMKIENDFRVAAPIEQAWALLTDIPAIAPCLPGAELTGQEGDDFHGQMKVKVGPVTAEYAGTATVVEMNETDRIVVLKASGRDKRGAGNASADITATMTEDGDGTVVAISTDLKVSGKVAQFGRGVMADVSKKLLGQFAECIEGKLDRPEGGDGSAAEESAAIDDDAAADTSDPGDGKDEDVLDLLEVAGGAVAKRLIPVAIAVIAVVVVVILVLS